MSKVKGLSKVINIEELKIWIAEINKRVKQSEEIKRIDEESLVPIVDAMLTLFEDKIEDFIEKGNLKMKEL